MEDGKISELVKAQRAFFTSGASRTASFRLEALGRLDKALAAAEPDIFAALKADLGKSRGEAWLTELGLLKSEIRLARRKLKAWMKPRRARTPLYAQPGRSRIYPEPLGLVLSLSPWNYPLQLALVPLVAAVASGNCCIMKPSSKAPVTAELVRGIVSGVFEPEHACVVTGGPETGRALLEQRFDFIMYTGSARVGREVMAAATRDLTPLCLELGGKSPVIVLPDADLRLAARRIAWGKTLNAGQTCIAPDYVLAHDSVKSRLESLLRDAFMRFPGPDAVRNDDYARIITGPALQRLVDLSGGLAAFDPSTGRMAPMLLPEAGPADPVMREEIFGPLLPVLPFAKTSEAVDFVRARPRPLACYIFSGDAKKAGRVLDALSFGGGCVNDTMLHFGVSGLPFGGVGESGLGRYHGKAGFDMMSNLKGVTHRAGRIDPPLRYPPYGRLARALLRIFVR